MLNKQKLIELLSEAIIAVFEQGLDEDEHFKTSLANSYTPEQLGEISQEDIQAALSEAKSDLLELTFVMVDELINKK